MTPNWRSLFTTRPGRRPARPAAKPGLEKLEERLAPTVSFLGVGSGDATSNDAILWTRAQDSASAAGVPLTAVVSTDPNIGSGMLFAATTSPGHDYTVHLDAAGLQPGTKYYFRFSAADGTLSPVGTFFTAPAATTAAPLHFGFSGDAQGVFRPYISTADVANPGAVPISQQNFNYFVFLGDVIYEIPSGSPGNNNSPGVPDAYVPGNNETAVLQAYWTKYREQLQPVNTGSYPGLQSLFTSAGHYTLLDNHELGNKQFDNGGAPTGSPAGATPVVYGGSASNTGAIDPSNPANDVNTTGSYINQTPGFKALEQAYTDYEPIRLVTVSAPNDPRSDGTQKLYFSQQWGANDIFFNLDDRSYRDIRLLTAKGADDGGPRADNPNRTMLGATQLQWFEQGLVQAQAAGTIWKFVAISSPIDQTAPVNGSFPITNVSQAQSDGGKSWMGGYRAERNQLLKFIADNHIDHVVFLTTDDHQVRTNEVGYFTQFNADGTPVQSSYTRVPGCFQILVGPLGGSGPDLFGPKGNVPSHNLADIQAAATSYASQQQGFGLDPIGLDPAFPGLKNVYREGDPNADALRSAFDFYSPDTDNYASLDVDATGQTLSVNIYGINSYVSNTFPQPSASNPLRKIMGFQIGLQRPAVSVSPVTAGFGAAATLVATATDAATGLPLANKTVVFSVGGQVVGTAVTNSAGKATLSNVTLPASAASVGVYSGGVSARFAGDQFSLAGGGQVDLVVTGSAATRWLVVGAGPGTQPTVKVYNPDGSLKTTIMAFDPSFTGGVNVAVGDVNGDGTYDIVVAAGKGGGPQVKVFSGKDFSLLTTFYAFDPSFTGGVSIAAADVDGDGKADIIVGAGQGGGPQVKAFRGTDLAVLDNFYAFDAGFTGGVNVAGADFEGTHKADIITGAGAGGGPLVKIFRPTDLAVLQNFLALDPSLRGGAYVAAGDVTGVGKPSLIVGAGAGGQPQVKVFDEATLTVTQAFLPFDPSFTGGVRVAAVDLNGDGRPEVTTAAAGRGGPQVKGVDGVSGAVIDNFFAYDPSFTGGVSVA